jgi:hypothetical protein
VSVVCPAGHASDESDYCSVCGVAIGAGAQRLTPTPPHPSHRGPRAQACPVCGEARVAGARFCEVCRYDFVSGGAGPPPKAVPAAKPLAPAPPVAAPATAAKWQLVLTIDPSLDTEPDPAAPPPVEPQRVFPVDLPEMLVGRRDDRQNIRPAVPVHDPGASRRHARFLLGTDGAVSLHDLASTNGTRLNGNDVVAGSVVPLQAGDEVTLGRWTRIRLQVRP